VYALRALAALATVTLVIAGIVAIFDPVPGDEVAAFAAAAALLAFARDGAVPKAYRTPDAGTS
jgi:hypothetical protein